MSRAERIADPAHLKRPETGKTAGAVPAAKADTMPMATDVPPAQLTEDACRRLDRRVHARLGALSGGLSAIALAGAWADWAAHLAISPGKQLELAWKAGQKWQRLGSEMMQATTGLGPGAKAVVPLPQDDRFSAPQWQRFPYNLLHQSFLLQQQWWHDAAMEIPGVATQNQRLVEFFSRQILDMVSPSNALATNPELLDRTVQEGGANLVRGYVNWVADMTRLLEGRHHKIPAAFCPGEGVALTPGKVVLRNHLIELIQYAPATPTVGAVPLLIVPAWIMRYYILDLTPEDSLIRWLVAQGFTVFCISWKNPDASDRDLGFDDYLQSGVMAALDAVCAITGVPKVNAVGYCLGGTLLAIAAAAMARDGDDRIATLSMLAAQVDFSEAGELSLFTSEAQVALLEDMMWETGYLDQRQMAGAFNLLRSRDLIWSRNVRRYLLGMPPETTAMGAWSADATRMPYRMHADYLRRLFIENDLALGRFVAAGRTVFLADIRVPVFAVATERDHIAPWKSVFKLTYLLHGDATFALVSGGHNTGIVAAPGNPRAGRRILLHTTASIHSSPEDWAASVPVVPGSWWPDWADWLGDNAGAQIAPPPLGNPAAGYPGVADAPGTYVCAP